MKHRPALSIAFRFLGLGTTLAAAIGLGAIAGQKLDEHFELQKPLATALGALLGLAIGMWTVVRSLKKG